MHLRHSMGLALISVGVLVPTVLSKPIFGLGGIWNDIKKTITQIADSGLSDLIGPIQQEARDLLNGAFSQSPGQPFSADLLPFLVYSAEYASASYCDGTHVVGKGTQCRDPFCPTITKNTVFTEAEFSNKGEADTTGIVVRDVTMQTIAVAYRGSQSIRNWFTNAQIGKVPIPEWCAGCEVHSGFLDAFREEQSTVIDSVTRLMKANPSYQLIITGHSLGGAVATLAATELRKRGFQATLVTYGAPRVGNEALAKFISSNEKNFRVTHLDDPVPRLPPLTLGYRHLEPEYHISGGDYPIAASDIKVYSGLVNFLGNTGWGGLGSFNTSAHRQYFLPGKFSACDNNMEGRIEFR